MGRKKKSEVQTLATTGTMNVRLKNEDNVQLMPQTTSEIVTHGDSTVSTVLDGKQDKLTAGTGIAINGTTISCTVEGGSGEVDLSDYLKKSDAADTYATKSEAEAAQSAATNAATVAESAQSAASAAEAKAEEVADALASLQSALEALQTTVNNLEDIYLKLTGGTLTGTLNVGDTKIEVGTTGITLPSGIRIY